MQQPPGVRANSLHKRVLVPATPKQAGDVGSRAILKRSQITGTYSSHRHRLPATSRSPSAGVLPALWPLLPLSPDVCGHIAPHPHRTAAVATELAHAGCWTPQARPMRPHSLAHRTGVGLTGQGSHCRTRRGDSQKLFSGLVKKYAPVSIAGLHCKLLTTLYSPPSLLVTPTSHCPHLP